MAHRQFGVAKFTPDRSRGFIIVCVSVDASRFSNGKLSDFLSCGELITITLRGCFWRQLNIHEDCVLVACVVRLPVVMAWRWVAAHAQEGFEAHIESKFVFLSANVIKCDLK